MVSDDGGLVFIGIMLVCALVAGIGAALSVEELRPVVGGVGILLVLGGIIWFKVWEYRKETEFERYWTRRRREYQRRYDCAQRELYDLYRETMRRL
jgi:hypothetical protein